MPEPEQVIDGKPASAESELWVKLGEKLIVESLDIYDRRSQQMIVASGSLATLYLAILRYLGIEVATPNLCTLLALLPGALLLVATAVFAMALLPVHYRMNRFDVDDIRLTYDRIVCKASKLTFVGYFCFVSAILVIVIVSYLLVSGYLK
jgi:hypothetical protein